MAKKTKTMTKGAAWALTAAASLPVLMAFNENGNEAVNIIGVAYVCLAYLFGRRLIPGWVARSLRH